MAELTIDPSEITEALRRHVAEYTPTVGSEQVGRIVEVGDGIARVSGLPAPRSTSCSSSRTARSAWR